MKKQQYYSGKGSQKKCFEREKDSKFFLMRQKEIGIGKSTNTYTGFKDITEYLNYCRKEKKRNLKRNLAILFL